MRLRRMLVVFAILLFAVAVFPGVSRAQGLSLEALPLGGAHIAEMMAAAGGQVAAGPQFFYVVTSVDSSARESVFSNEASATLSPTSTSVTLTWTAPVLSTVAGYNVYRAKVTGGSYAKINVALVTGGTSYTDPFPLPGVPSGLIAKPN